MIKAYLSYTIDQVAVIKLDKYREGEAKRWATDLFNSGHDVFIGKYSIRNCRWRWFNFIPGRRTNFRLHGKRQTELPNIHFSSCHDVNTDRYAT